MIRQDHADEFVKMLWHEDIAIADALGIDLTQEELRYIKEWMVWMWLIEKMTHPGFAAISRSLANSWHEVFGNLTNEDA